MTEPRRTTPNPATVRRPERSSTRVTRKAPLGWLPWALLGALAALLLLTLLLVRAAGDDGAGTAGADSVSREGAGGEGSAGGGAGPGSDPLARLSEQALVGGGGVPPGPARETGAQALADQPGTAGAVLFAEGSAEIDEAGQQVLAAAVTALREAGTTSVEVVGHTDLIAGDPVNDTLSQERADAVAAALRDQLPGVDVVTAARGQDEPIADNGSEEGRQLNRRAVITARG